MRRDRRGRRLRLERLEDRRPMAVAFPDVYWCGVNDLVHEEAPGVTANDQVAGEACTLISGPVDAAGNPAGRVSLKPSGSIVFAPDAGSRGVFTCVYAVDGSEAVVTFLVGAPAVEPDVYTIAAGTPLVVQKPGPLVNDEAVGGGPLRFQVDGEASAGELVWWPDGWFAWTPPKLDPAWVGQATFVYCAIDEWGAWSEGLVTVTVAAAEAGYEGDVEVARPGSAAVASWTFEVADGTHDVFVTWPLRVGAASNALYTIEADGVEVRRRRVDQRRAPDDWAAYGAVWEYLGTVTAREQIVVKLTEDGADGLIFADACLVRRDDAAGAVVTSTAVPSPLAPPAEDTAEEDDEVVVVLNGETLAELLEEVLDEGSPPTVAVAAVA